MFNRVATLILLILATAIPAPSIAQDGGRFIEYEHVATAGLPEQRLTIWLPPGYDVGDKRYPVLYMHDGHNLFDPAKSNFNKVWAADKAVISESAAGHIEPWIIVGMWPPGSDRYRQYLPAPAYAAASPGLRKLMDAFGGGAPVVSAQYLDWIAGPLKQWVDASFRTRTGPGDTAIVGSSMGGLMSSYAFLKRPDIFGRAGCVSAHWPAVGPEDLGDIDPEVAGIWDTMFAENLGDPNGRRIWFDHGTATLDAYYAPYQHAIDRRMELSGWTRGRDWESKVYDGAEHEENAWAARLPEILEWLLAKE